MNIIEEKINNLYIYNGKKRINIYKLKWKKIMKKIRYRILIIYLHYINHYYIDYLEQTYNIIIIK